MGGATSCAGELLLATHRDLAVYERAVRLAVDLYRLTGRFPREERFGLVAQMRRAAVSVGANIAEGAARGTTREFAHFLVISRGSLVELETLLAIATRLGFPSDAAVAGTIESLLRMLNALLRSLRHRQSSYSSASSPL